jgi:Fe2+ transport system protein FeoA
MAQLIPITLLRPGEVAEVRQVVGRPHEVRRLEELGLRDGCVLEMIRGGSPCIVRVGGSTLCLRNGARLSVLVAPRMSA